MDPYLLSTPPIPRPEPEPAPDPEPQPGDDPDVIPREPIPDPMPIWLMERGTATNQSLMVLLILAAS